MIKYDEHGILIPEPINFIGKKSEFVSYWIFVNFRWSYWKYIFCLKEVYDSISQIREGEVLLCTNNSYILEQKSK